MSTLSAKFVRFCFAGSLVLGLFLFTGCQNKFTYTRWEMIHVGTDDKTTVEAAIGAPQEKPFKDLWWYYKGNKTAKIYFDEKGRVKAKKWIDEVTGEMCVEPKGWIEK